jgi:tungstate transport system substrate-binding protein
VVLTALAVAACGEDDASAPADKGSMILATTTSTQDSGLLDELVPEFQDESACSVKTVAVGSGEALELGERGNADALLVHSPAAEEEFMDGGHGVSRSAVMHNDFVVAGPAEDPAKVRGAGSAAEAFTRISKEQAPFASRADESGTHTKELSIWEAAGVEPGGSWYVETGQGMGETLTIAGQKRAYTLADRGTFLATDNVDLDLLVEGGSDLLNPYHVIVVEGEGVNRECAEAFADWITSPETQGQIEVFGVAEYGEPLFFPDAKS